MKGSALFILALTSFSVRAQTSIQFKLTGEVHSKKGSTPLDLGQLNQKLRKKKLKSLPESLSFTKSGSKAWQDCLKTLREANKSLKTDIELTADQGYFYEFPEICYVGKASEVPDVIEALMGSVFHSEQGILAVRFNTVKIIHEPEAFMEGKPQKLKAYKVSHPEEVKAWFNFSPKDQSVVLMTDSGESSRGEELKALTIKPCR